MKDHSFIKLPRLYVTDDLAAGKTLSLNDQQAHYLRSVMRSAAGDSLRLFNGRDGEWLATVELIDKKSVLLRCAKSIKLQPAASRPVHLLFAPIKDRLDFLIEKSVELGVTELHPVLTQNTAVRTINEERLNAQIIEAAEQCERLDVPVLHDLLPLGKKLAAWPASLPMIACLERKEEAPLLNAVLPVTGAVAFLIGPEGGFTESETACLKSHTSVAAASLGPSILRAETAVCAALACLIMKK